MEHQIDDFGADAKMEEAIDDADPDRLAQPAGIERAPQCWLKDDIRAIDSDEDLVQQSDIRSGERILDGLLDRQMLGGNFKPCQHSRDPWLARLDQGLQQSGAIFAQEYLPRDRIGRQDAPVRVAGAQLAQQGIDFAAGHPLGHPGVQFRFRRFYRSLRHMQFPSRRITRARSADHARAVRMVVVR